MGKTILLTGATDGIGLEAAKRLADEPHTLLLHGRSERKLAELSAMLSGSVATLETWQADLSSLAEVVALASAVSDQHTSLDVLINNAGVFQVPHPQTADGDDLRFIVNTVAPYLLTRRLLPLMSANGRVINLSSAAQAPVDLDALAGRRSLTANAAYAQSKLAITQWSIHLARTLPADAPLVVAVNPASLLGSKMVREAYGTAGKDLGIGADILVRAALSDQFADASGRYFDNDQQRFADPHPDALDPARNAAVVAAIEAVVARLVN